MVELKAKLTLDNLARAFESFLETYPEIEYGQQIHPFDSFILWRTLLRRNPDPITELPNVLYFKGTYREMLNNLSKSREFEHHSPIIPAGHCWMAEVDTLRFWFDTGDSEMGLAIAMGNYERDSIELLKKTIKPGMHCIDAGANTGYYTCLMGKLVGQTGKVYAFEPMPTNFRMLQKNIEENSLCAIVEAHELACSSNRTVIKATKLTNMLIAGFHEAGEQVTMDAVPVDEIVEGSIDLLKIDVEGHEIEALNGMKKIIRNYRPIIFSEINEYWLRTCANSSGKDYLEYLNTLGYQVYNVKNPDIELRSNNFFMDILETMDVIAKPIS